MATQKDKDVVVETINILVSTNIPDQANVSLTSKVIVSSSINAKLYNEYPYITDTIRIREGFLINKPYNDILDYFFIKDTFVRYTKEMMKTKDEDDTYASLEGDEKRVKYIESNIKTMLRMIFNTFPINGNVTSSLEKDYIDKLYNINKYSYLSIGSKKYTIAKVVWIDDIYNHYVTKQLVRDYKDFTAWKGNEKRSIENRLKDNTGQKTRIIGAWNKIDKNLIILDDNIEKIIKYISNEKELTTTTENVIRNRNALDGLLAHLIILKLTVLPANATSIEAEIDKLGTIKADDRKKTITDLINKRSTYNYETTPEFIVEMNRTSDIIIKSGIVSIHSSIQSLIKDLTDNNNKFITIEDETRYLELESAMFGNEKYKNENFKTLTGAINKNLQVIKNMINLKKKKLFDENQPPEFKGEFDENSIYPHMVKNLVARIQKTDLKPDVTRDAAGIIFDNNNVKTPKFEVYFYIDLVDGYVTDDNKIELDLCTFRDELLLIKFNQIMNDEVYALQHDPLIKVVDINKDKEKEKEKEKKGGTKKNRVIRNKTQRISKLW
jgi:hypothetical protein